MMNLQTSPLFNSMPENIKESIMQSGIDFANEAHLQKFVDNIKNEISEIEMTAQ